MNINDIIKKALDFNWDVGIDELRDEIKVANKNIDTDNFEWLLAVMHTHMKVHNMTQLGSPIEAWWMELNEHEQEVIEYLISQWAMITFDHEESDLAEISAICSKHGLNLQW